MRCAEVRALVGAYLDSELETETTARVNAHLQSCAACADRFRAEETLERLLRERLAREEPGDEELFSRLLHAATRRRWSRRRLLAVAAVLVAAAAGAWFAVPRASKPSVIALALRDHRRRVGDERSHRIVPAHVQAAASRWGGAFPPPGYVLASAHRCALGPVTVSYVGLSRRDRLFSVFVVAAADAKAFAEGMSAEEGFDRDGAQAIAVPRGDLLYVVVGTGADALADQLRTGAR